jgi:lipid-binding SYLF domain-containing protein
MKRYIACVFAVTLIASFALASGSYADNKWTNLVEESGKVLAEIQEMPDQSIPEDLLRGCKAIAIFPNTVSGGFIIGGKYGQGIIMVRDQDSGKWSAPAIFTIAGGSFGWQIGGQATDFVLLIMNRRSVDGILEGRFKVGADASAAAGPVGRAAEASTDAHLKGGILSYSRSRGLFAGAKLEGAVITEQPEGNAELYGKPVTAKEVMIRRQVNMPSYAGEILKVLNRYPAKPKGA